MALGMRTHIRLFDTHATTNSLERVNERESERDQEPERERESEREKARERERERACAKESALARARARESERAQLEPGRARERALLKPEIKTCLMVERTHEVGGARTERET